MESVMKGERHTSMSRILFSDAISPAHLYVCTGIDASKLAILFETLLTSDREPSTLLSFKLAAFTQEKLHHITSSPSSTCKIHIIITQTHLIESQSRAIESQSISSRDLL